MSRYHQLSVTDALARMAAGSMTAVALAEDCLARIAEREETVRAWAFLDPQLVIEAARARDREPRRGVLHGIPVGIKDIIDTADMPTAYGSPIYAGYRPRADASCVAALRAAGAVILGKAVTVEFAVRHPSVTRNPRNPDHTPGGSSSGSAAAVADDMVPLALGTQTGGSTIRPASFCGVVGFKPTFNVINRAGVKPNSESFDTVGVLARSVDDVALAYAAMTNGAACDLGRVLPGPPRIGFCRTPLWHKAEHGTVALLEGALPRLAAAGAVVREVVLPPPFDAVTRAHGIVNDYELLRALAWELDHHGAKISGTLAAKLAEARTVGTEDYVSAQRTLADCRRRLDDIMRDHDVLFVPAAPGEAPRGHASTGDSSFNRLWTALHVPAVTVPVFAGPQGLPIGAQLVGGYGKDQPVLACARWAHRVLV